MRKRCKKITLAILSMMMMFILTGQTAMAVGVSVDRDANPVAEDGYIAPDTEQEQQTAVDMEDEADIPEQELNQDGTPVLPAPEEQPAEEATPEEVTPEVKPIQKLGAAADSLAGNSNPYTQRLDMMRAGTPPLYTTSIPAPQNRATDTFDIGAANLTITDTGYTYGTDTGATPAAGYKIIGTTTVNSILVQSGIATIKLTDVSMNLSGQSNTPALTVSAGATVNLHVDNTVKPSSVLTGGISSAAIKVEPGGRLFVHGAGVLTLQGGSGAPAIGGNADSPTGGYVSFENALTKIYAYSNSTGGAINMLNVRATNAKLLKGTLAPGAVQAAPQTIKVQNRNDGTEAYALSLPAEFNSFAVTTTATGGEYITYIDGKEVDHELLVSGSGTHVFNLLNSNEVADLKDLTSTVVNYRVTYHANTGFFTEGSSQVGTISVDVPFNSTLTPTSNLPQKVNNQPEKTGGQVNWYTNADGTGGWNFASDLLVRDTTLYVKWIPDICTVYFKGGYNGAPTLIPSSIQVNYGQKINLRDVPELGDNRTGYKRDGWITEDNKKWNFDTDIVTKENMTLSGNWRRECSVIFSENAPAGQVSNMPGSPKAYFVGDTIGTVSEPRRAGYAFTGWYKTSKIDLTKPAWDVSNTKLTDLSTTLYAGWAVDPCEVLFYTNTGGDATSKQVRYKEPITPLTDTDVTKPPRRDPADKYTEYKLEGWYTDARLTKRWNFDTPLASLTSPFDLYAKWRQVDCYVTFKGNEGAIEVGGNREAQIVEKVTYDQKVNQPNFQREGYDLTSWTVNDERGEKWLFDTKVKEDITLMANWEVKKYKLTFDAGGGSPANGPFDVQYDTLAPSSVVQPKRPGYAFDGWYSSADYAETSKWDLASTKMPAQDTTLHAKWEPLAYTVYFDTLGGEPSALAEQGPLEYTDGITDPITADPLTKAHYTFEGWYSNSEYRGSAWDFDDKTIGDAGIDLVEDEPSRKGSLTLYAKWKPEVYTVTFKADTTKPDEPEPDLPAAEREQQVEYNTPVVRPNYPETEWKGHTLLGWYSDPTFTEESKWSFSDEEEPILLDGPITLYAKWQCNEYRVGFVVEEEDPVWSDVTYHYGKTIANPEDPVVKPNYEFEGWYSNPERTGDKWNFQSDRIESDSTDIIFYAKYLGEPRTLNIYIIYEEGNPKYDTPILQTKQVRYGDKLELTDIANETNEHTKKRPGYTLNGWTTDEAGTTLWDFENSRIAGNSIDEATNLYGKWSRDKYTITFDTMGGEKIPTQICEYEWKIKKPSPDPKKTHYQFQGWFKEKAYENEWDFGADLVYGHTTLYAKWQPNVYKLLFETNGGSKLGAVDVEYGTMIPPEALQTKKEGYFVGGWYRDPDFTIPFDVKKDLVDEDKMTLYAKWELNNYTVKYQITDTETNEEVIEVDPKTYHSGDKLKKPNFAREHKTLSTWYQDPGYTEKWLFKRDKVKGDTTLYAYWDPTLYKVHFETYGGNEITDLELVWGSQFENPGDATKEGYTFTGWYADSNYTTLWDFEEDFVDGDTTVYAGWTTNSYTVSFNGDGGNPVPEAMVLPFGSLVPKPEDPTKEGVIFAGWLSDKKAGGGDAAEVWNFDADTVPGDITLTAQWATEEGEGGGGGAGGGESSSGSAQTQEEKTTSGNTADDTLGKAADQLKSAADTLAKIMTGDDAPLLWAIVGVMLSAVGIAWVLMRKFRRK